MREFIRPIALATHRLSPADVGAGERWYPQAAAELEVRIARPYLVPFERACWAAAAISPGLSWPATITALQLLVDAHDAGEPFPRTGIQATFGFRGHERAWRILTTDVDPTSVARGPKVEAFASNLLGDYQPVVVDRHLARAAGLDRQPNRSEYDRIARALATVALTMSLRPAHLQAALWSASATSWRSRRA